MPEQGVGSSAPGATGLRWSVEKGRQGGKQPQVGNLSLTVPYSFLLGLDQGGDACVHEIPFRFDLLGLLPQCQQLQMFFLLLSRGRYTWKLLTLT